MAPVFALQPFPRSILLWGPLEPDAPSWRMDAATRLQALGFEGAVYVTDEAPGAAPGDKDALAAWRRAAQHQADVIVVWLPQAQGVTTALLAQLDTLLDAHGAKVLLGHPRGEFCVSRVYPVWGKAAPRLRTLDDLLSLAIARVATLPSYPTRAEAPPASAALEAARKALADVRVRQQPPDVQRITSDLSGLSPQQLAIFGPWADLRQPLRGPGGRFELTVTPTAIGTTYRVKCLVTGDKLDLSDYASW